MAPPGKEREGQRIAKLLARAGVASRRDIERMIEERRIAINGVALETPATLLTSLNGVTVDGMPVKAPEPARLFRYHKPTGLLTAARDPAGRPTIYDRLPKDLPRVMPVGRLDMNTEGLLLLTTDGELKRQLELPSTGVERTYRARVFGDVSQEQLEELIHGVEIEGIRYGAIDANLERRTGRNGWVEMRLTEGKNREVRRVLEYLGLQVSRLLRVSYGPFTLGDLQPGDVDEVRQHDLVAFKKALDGKGRMPTAAEVEGARPPQIRARADQPARPAAPRPARAGPREDRPARPGAPRPTRPGYSDDRPARAEGRPARAPARGERVDAARSDRRTAPDRTRGTRDDRPGQLVDRPRTRTGPRRGEAPERPGALVDRPKLRPSRAVPGEQRAAPKRGPAPDRGPRGDRPAPRSGKPGPKGPRSPGRGAPKR